MQQDEALILANEVHELSEHFELVDRQDVLGVAILNRELLVVRSNGRFAELAAGLSPRRDGRQRLDDFIPEVADEVEHICRLVLDSGRDMREIALSISRAWQRVDWLLDCRPVKNERARPLGVCLTVRGAGVPPAFGERAAKIGEASFSYHPSGCHRSLGAKLDGAL